ncbi:hypothetical protein HK405_006291, partial [Cladochytrium tenue]
EFAHGPELQRWERMGAVELRVVFSREEGAEEATAVTAAAAGCRHVDELILRDSDELAELFRQGAHVYVCGSAAKLGKSVSDAVVAVYREKRGCSTEEATAWLDSIKGERYVTDVFK